MSDIIILVGLMIALAMGSVLGYFARRTIAKKQINSIEEKLSRLTETAKHEAQETILRARSRAVKILEEVKKEEKQRQIELANFEKRVSRREEIVEKQAVALDQQRQHLVQQTVNIKQIREQVDVLNSEARLKLAEVAGLNEEQAKAELLSIVEQQHKVDLVSRLKKLEQDASEALEKRSKELITLAMQKYAASHAVELTTTSVDLPSDELKGRIIGKEGRNIKSLERLTGVELIVDDTPGAVVLSSFDPIRRQVAKIALEKLMSNGRIQPARIEEAVILAREEVADKIQEAGETAIYDVGVAGLDPKLVKLLGRLRFRTSYGQNVLLHSLEVAHLSSVLAAELGADVALCKKAGLLHDIGKAVDHQIQGSHIEIGKAILAKFGVDDKVIEAMAYHHDDFVDKTPEAVIIRVADAISASRPGARKDTLEAYIKRLEELEKVANSFGGVEKSYAIQAGREVRVFVRPEEIDDLASRKLARDIAEKIQEELKYPGEIKVTLVRETRVIEYAK